MLNNYSTRSHTRKRDMTWNQHREEVRAERLNVSAVCSFGPSAVAFKACLLGHRFRYCEKETALVILDVIFRSWCALCVKVDRQTPA